MTKEKLRKYCWLKKNIEELEERLFQVETKARCITASMEKDFITGGVIRDRMAERVAEMADISITINEQLRKAYQLEKEIEDAIDSLDEREKYLIRLKYIRCMTWPEVCVEMNYTWQHIHRIHAMALEQIKDESK